MKLITVLWILLAIVSMGCGQTTPNGTTVATIRHDPFIWGHDEIQPLVSCFLRRSRNRLLINAYPYSYDADTESDFSAKNYSDTPAVVDLNTKTLAPAALKEWQEATPLTLIPPAGTFAWKWHGHGLSLDPGPILTLTVDGSKYQVINVPREVSRAFGLVRGGAAASETFAAEAKLFQDGDSAVLVIPAGLDGDKLMFVKIGGQK